MTVHAILSRALGLVPLSMRKRIKSIPGLAAMQRAVVKRTLDGREFEHTVDVGPAKGMKFLVRLPDDKGIWTGTYEIHFATRLAASVKPSTVAFDIGGWHGFFAGVMAAQGAAQVHVFEPLPVNADRIRKLVELNPGKPISLHPIAIGNQDTDMNLLVLKETSMARLEASASWDDQGPTACISVPVRSLDSIVASGAASPPTLMKIDVEGAEMLVLKGARNILQVHRPEIFAEIHSPALLKEVTATLEQAGYIAELLDRGDTEVQPTDVVWLHATPS